jgi:hypothetical protein
LNLGLLTRRRKFEVSLEVVRKAALIGSAMDIFGKSVIEIENVRPVISHRNSDGVALESPASDGWVVYCNSFELIVFAISER